MPPFSPRIMPLHPSYTKMVTFSDLKRNSHTIDELKDLVVKNCQVASTPSPFAFLVPHHSHFRFR